MRISEDRFKYDELLAKITAQGTLESKIIRGRLKKTISRGRQKKTISKEWTANDFVSTTRAAKDGTRWKRIVAKSPLVSK